MKKYIKIAALFLISVEYCFIVDKYNSHSACVIQKTTSNHDLMLSEAESFEYMSLNLSQDRINTGKIVNIVKTGFQISIKNCIKTLFQPAEIIESNQRTKVLNYIFCSQNLAFPFPKTDIIFPFHYFW